MEFLVALFSPLPIISLPSVQILSSEVGLKYFSLCSSIGTRNEDEFIRAHLRGKL
jgi:hypothetical protein